MSMDLSSNESRPLSNNILLAGEEVFEARGGRGGFETVFVASERKVIHKKWFWDPRHGNMNEEEELPIPDNITSEEELRHYVEMHQSWWLG